MGDWQQIDWLGLRLAVPADWEIVRHSCRADRGRLILVDRRRQRLALHWTACESEPDAQQTLDDQRSKDLLTHPDATFTPLDAPAWHGYRLEDQELRLTRAGYYDPRGKRWIDVALPWPDQVDEAIEQRLLDEIESLQPAEEAQHIRAFGLNVKSPPEWSLASARIEPGRMRLRYTHAKRHEATVTRLKAAEAWFDGDFEAMLRKEIKTKPRESDPRRYGQHEAWRCSSREPGPVVNGLFGWLRQRRDLAWLCPTQHSIFRITTYCPRRRVIEPEAFEVYCCDQALLQPEGLS